MNMDPFDQPEHPAWMPGGRYCVQCDTETHVCPGCGASIKHGTYACADCADPITETEAK